MWCIQTITTLCCIILFFGQEKVDGATRCKLSTSKPVESVAQITTNLQHIVKYCEEKIAEMEARKSGVESQLKQLERQNVTSSQEKRVKEKKLEDLKEDITGLRKIIVLLQKRSSATVAKHTQVTKRIGEANRRIVVASSSIYKLQVSIKGKQDHIDALLKRINKAREKAERRCHFERDRRSVRAPRVRRGFRLRRTFRRIGRFARRVVDKVAKETRRAVRKVYEYQKCIVNNALGSSRRCTRRRGGGGGGGREGKQEIHRKRRSLSCIDDDSVVSRLSRFKEKAEREKNGLNQQLLQAQREKVNIEDDRRELIAQRDTDNRALDKLNASLRTMRKRLTASDQIKRLLNSLLLITAEWDDRNNETVFKLLNPNKDAYDQNDDDIFDEKESAGKETKDDGKTLWQDCE